jgi:hypothetical protein
MRKLLAIGLGAAGALTLTGVAIAHLTPSGTTAESATFTATTVQSFRSRTCTGPDGQYQLIDAMYAGTSSSGQAELSGDTRIRIHSAYNTTERLGWATGWMKLHGTGALRFDAVDANGKLTGFVRGRVGGNVGDLLASFTSDFSSSGLANGQLGGGGSAPNAGVLAGRICTTRPVGKSVKLNVRGTIDAISSTSVTVAPEDGSAMQTCALGPGSPNATGFLKGQRVDMTCATVGGTLTVVRLKKRG